MWTYPRTKVKARKLRFCGFWLLTLADALPRRSRCACGLSSIRVHRKRPLFRRRARSDDFVAPGRARGRAGRKRPRSDTETARSVSVQSRVIGAVVPDPCGWFTPTFARNRSGSESRWSISSKRACGRNAIFSGETCTRARESVGAQSALLGELCRWVGSVTRVWTSHCG